MKSFRIHSASATTGRIISFCLVIVIPSIISESPYPTRGYAELNYLNTIVYMLEKLAYYNNHFFDPLRAHLC